MTHEFHEHHFRNHGRARDHLTETIVSLQSAVERMTGDDWIDARTLSERGRAFWIAGRASLTCVDTVSR